MEHGMVLSLTGERLHQVLYRSAPSSNRPIEYTAYDKPERLSTTDGLRGHLITYIDRGADRGAQ